MTRDNSFWGPLGFRQSPYDSDPLGCDEEGHDLLIGRDDEALDLATTFEQSTKGVAIVSGPPGVGKTSFVNVVQYRLESRKADFGPRLLAARKLGQVAPGASARDVVEEAVRALYRSIEAFCEIHDKPIPKRVRAFETWVRADPKGKADLSLSVTLMGFGGGAARAVSIPPISEAGAETLREVIDTMAFAATEDLGVDGCLIVMDNSENVERDAFYDILFELRDTLFQCHKVWWVLIGSGGLDALLRVERPRLGERFAPGVELAPLTLDELHGAIDARVRRFHVGAAGTAPLSRSMHERLFQASSGEIRFVLARSNDVCRRFVLEIRRSVRRLMGDRPMANRSLFDAELGKGIKDGQIPDHRASEILIDIVREPVARLQLSHDDVAIARRLAEGNRSDDLDADAIQALLSRHVLKPVYLNGAFHYVPVGVVALAIETGLLNEPPAP